MSVPGNALSINGRPPISSSSLAGRLARLRRAHDDLLDQLMIAIERDHDHDLEPPMSSPEQDRCELIHKLLTEAHVDPSELRRLGYELDAWHLGVIATGAQAAQLLRALSGGALVLQLHDLQGNIVATVEDSETATKLLSTYNSTEFGVPTTGSPPKYSWLGAGGVASELTSSGISTQNGASYVPQVARALQAAPVVPPGAFPNDQAGTSFTAVPGAWTPTDQAEANHATEEVEAERQKAREIEAAEALQQCREEGGCGAEEITDPIDHYRAWEAKDKAAKLLKLVAAGELTEALGGLFGTFAEAVDGYIEAHVTTEVAFTWLEEYGQFLEFCVEELEHHHDSHGGCRASYSDIGPVPDFWLKPVISYCLTGKNDRSAIDGLELSDCTREAYSNEIGSAEA